MKNRLLILGALAALLNLLPKAYAENIYWQPLGSGGLSFQLPNSGDDIEPLIGADVRFKQGVAGLQTSFLNIYREVDLNAGGVGVAPAHNNVQPYVALSFDLKKHLYPLSLLTDLKLNVATRYNTDAGGDNFVDHLGAIFSVAYKFRS